MADDLVERLTKWARGLSRQVAMSMYARTEDMVQALDQVELLEKAIAEITTLRSKLKAAEEASFQTRVHAWMLACFGSEIAADKIERNHRFLEEALELVQANGCTPSEAHQLVDYVFGRPEGDLWQEVGGVMVTLAALCTAAGEDMAHDGERELVRVWTKVEAIREKQRRKPKHSPLPGAALPTLTEGRESNAARE